MHTESSSHEDMDRSVPRRKKITDLDWASHKTFPGSILCLNCGEVKPAYTNGPKMVAYCATCQEKGTVKGTLSRAIEKATLRREARKRKEKEEG